MPNGTVCELIRPRAAGESWKFTNLYAFKGVARNKSIGDGSGPLGVTFDNKGNLWGATASGGYCQLFEGGSCFGTLFLLTPPSAPAGAWTESVLHRFNNGNQNPISGVTIDKSGALYGVTYVETYRFFNGALTVIGTFSDCSGCGYAPTGGVVLDDAGNVYGVTAAGGQFGYGTVYELAMPDYSQVVLHSFAAGTDGWNPEEPLILGPNGALYGTTQDGGNQGCQLGFGSVGCGIVFELVPASGNGRPDRGGEPKLLRSITRPRYRWPAANQSSRLCVASPLRYKVLMNLPKRTIAAMELMLIFPAALFMTALFVRNLQPLQYQPAHAAESIVRWYSVRPHIGLWGLLIALPSAVVVTGCATLLRSWSDEVELRQATRQILATISAHLATILVAGATLTAGGVLAIVALHVLTD